MDALDNPCPLAMVLLLMIVSLDLTFNDKDITSCKTFFARRISATVSAITHELGNKLKNYWRMSDNSF